MSKLTEKQRRFAEEYLLDLNATQAAIRAGYSESTASQIGYRLIQQCSVQKEIQRLAAKRSKRTSITADEVLRGIHEIATADEVKTSDRLRAWELLGRHLALFRDVQVHHGKIIVETGVPQPDCPWEAPEERASN